MLAFIWMVSVILAVASIAAMLVLVVLRVLHERAAARRLGERESLQAALIQFTVDDDAQALKGIVSNTDPRVVVEVGFAFLDMLRGDERQRIAKVFAEAGLPDHIRRMLARGNDAKRLRAAEILTAFPNEETVRSLMRAMTDRSREVRIAAAISLARLDALPGLSDALRMIGPRGQRSRRLIELFQEVGSARMDELKIHALEVSAPTFVRAAAIDALSLSGDYQLIPVFEELAQDGAAEVAAAAMRALGRIAHPASAQRLLSGLASKDWEVRAEAAEAIGRVGFDDAAAPLAGLLDDNEWTVRYSAAKTLKGLGDAGMAQLRRLAAEGSARSQRTASLVLAEGQAR